MTLFRSVAGLALALLLAPAGALANDPPPAPVLAPPQPAAEARPPQRLGRSIALVRRQAEQLGVPPDLAQAVMMAESEGDPTRQGPTGETGLMGLRLATAMMLGFRGDQGDLFDPAVNATYGVAHLAQAWRIAGGDPCRTYVKYRTHYGEERTTGRHGEACTRLRTTLATLNSPLATQLAGPAKADEARPAAQAKPAEPEAKAVAAAPAPAEVKPAPETTTGSLPQPVAHPLPPIRPADLAALTPAPKPRPAVRAKAPVRAAARAAPKKAAAKAAEVKKAETKAAAAKPGPGVTLVAKTRQGAKSALTCKGKTCTLEKAASKN